MMSWQCAEWTGSMKANGLSGMLIIDLFHIALFSLLSSTLTALLSHYVIPNVVFYSAFWISTGVVYSDTALFSCCMVGATWNCCRLCARAVYNTQPCTNTLRGSSTLILLPFTDSLFYTNLRQIETSFLNSSSIHQRKNIALNFFLFIILLFTQGRGFKKYSTLTKALEGVGASGTGTNA